MQPRLENLSEKKLIGKRLTMSLADNRTAELWRGFMPRRREIRNNLNTDLISMQVYDHPLDSGNLHQTFEKWAAVEVSDFETIPDGLETFTLTGGLYAVFHYKGSSTDTRIFQYIFGTWLPESGYILDHRPHFEILGDRYKNADPDSEEDIWIPIQPKTKNSRTAFNTSREIPATIEQVYAAFSHPERLSRWWGPAGFTSTFKVCEFETGGRWSFTLHGPNGGNYPNECVFAEIEPARRIVIEHVSPPRYRLTLDLSSTPDGTLVSWSHAFESSDVARRIEHIVVPANDENLDRLTAEVLRDPGSD
jgi:AraC family transcriptional regulator